MEALDPGVAAGVAARFGIGSLLDAPYLAAAGWAAHNVLWHFVTTDGTWALKEIGREPGPQIETAAGIETAAHRAGVACPRPVPSLDGPWTITIEGRSFRCHEWVAASCPTTTLTADDAWHAGHALGLVHQLNLPYGPISTAPHTWGAAHWRTLVAAGRALKLSWSEHLNEAIEPILAIEAAAVDWAASPHRWVASHRDVRPDNTLRRHDGSLLLVDWDAAGPTVPGREVASALRWWEPHHDALLNGYEAVAGQPDLQEGAGENGGLLWWLELNVRLALDQPHNAQRQEATQALTIDLFPDRTKQP